MEYKSCPCTICNRCCCHKVEELKVNKKSCINREHGICRCREDLDSLKGKHLNRILKEGSLKEVLVKYGKTYKNLNFMANALGLTYQTLIYWLENYLRIKKEDFYRKEVCKSNCLVIITKGNYRHIFKNRFKGRCICEVGFDKLVIKISKEELYELYKDKFEIEKVDEDRYIVGKI